MVEISMRTTSMLSILRDPNLSNSLPDAIMNIAAEKEPTVYKPEKLVRDQFISSIIGSKNIEITYVCSGAEQKCANPATPTMIQP